MGAWIKNLFFRDEKVRRQLTIILDLPLYRLYLGQGPFQQWSLDILKRDRNKKKCITFCWRKEEILTKRLFPWFCFVGAVPLLFWIIGQNWDEVARVGRKFPTEISNDMVIRVGNFRPTLATLSQFCYPIKGEKENIFYTPIKNFIQKYKPIIK